MRGLQQVRSLARPIEKREYKNRQPDKFADRQAIYTHNNTKIAEINALYLHIISILFALFKAIFPNLKNINRSECDYTTIKFKNGSEIRSIDESDDSKRGYIRGRKLTDEEYQRIIYCEQVKAEEKLDEILKILGLKQT